MNSFNDEVCEFTSTPVTENFPSREDNECSRKYGPSYTDLWGRCSSGCIMFDRGVNVHKLIIILDLVLMVNVKIVLVNVNLDVEK
jgi:hypothetical protein